MKNSLLGSGDVKIVLQTSLISQWLVFFPIALISVLLFEPSFIVIWVMFIFSRLGQGGVYFYHWHDDKWGQSRL